MNNKAPKEHTNSGNVNRHQTTCTKTDRDLYRICPSKLSRRELENLYFTILENNVELKKNLNLQQEKIKTLSVKVQRLSYPRNGGCNGAGKDSPVTTAIVSEQRDSIIQLKRANERMAERIRVLNMKLSSVKQFAGKNKANNFMNATLSSSNTRSNCSTSCANLHKAGPSQVKTNSVGTETDFFAEKYSSSSCDVKCKPTIQELNEKINNLQEELQISRQRIEKLEALVMRLQGENQTVRGERAASEDALHQQDAKLDDLKEKLRCAEAKVNDMNVELTIEKKKRAELETELKLAGNIGNIMSSAPDKTTEETEQKKVGGEACATGEANLIRDELNVASDDVNRAQDKAQFVRDDVINVARNEVNRVPDDVEYNLGDILARIEINTEPDGQTLTRGEKDVARNEVNKVLEDTKIKQAEQNLAMSEVNKITCDIKLTRDEDNVSRNEDIEAPGVLHFVRGEQVNATRNEENRVPDDIEYDWGDFMAGTQLDATVSTWDHKILNNDELNEARNEINRALDDKPRGENNVTRNEVDKVPSGYTLTRSEEVVRNEGKYCVSMVPDDKELTSDDTELTINEVNRVPYDKEYKWGRDGMEMEKITNKEVDVPRIERKNEKNQVKSLRDDVKDDPEYRKQQYLNKNIETEKDQLNIKLNQDLIDKISELVSQLEMLKITAAGETYTVTDKIVKEKRTEFENDVKTKKPDTISSPANKQKLTPKSYDVKTKGTDHTLSQAYKQKPMQLKSYEAKPKKASRISHSTNKKNVTQYQPYDVKTKKASSPTSTIKQKQTQKLEDDKTIETDMIMSQINNEIQNQYETYDGKTEATDNISIRIDKDRLMKYESNDVKTEVDAVLIQKNKGKPTEEDDDTVCQMKEKLAEYESIEVPAEEADNILSNISKANAPKYESYDFETKESDDFLAHNDTIECILEINSANERNKYKIQEPALQEPAFNSEVKRMSRDVEQKSINYSTIPVEEFDSSHEQSIEKLSTARAIAQEIESKIVPKSPRSDDDARYQIPGPIPVNLNDQKSEDPFLRKSIDTPENITDSYRKRPNKISYVEKSKEVGSISESLLKDIIDEKSAISKDSYGESLRKKSLEEKSEKIRKTFSETPNRISLQQSSDDNIRKPFRDLTAWQSFDEKVMKISDTDDSKRPVKKSKDPVSTRPSLILSDKTTRISLDDSNEETLPYDVQPRLSLSPKTAARIKDYARDVETKSRKIRQRFSNPCATVMGTPDRSRIVQPTHMQAILKSKDCATSSSCIRESGVNVSPSTSFRFNKDVGYGPPTVGQESAGIEVATTTAHMRDVDERFEICRASAIVCVCPPSETRGVSAFSTCTGNIRFHTAQPKDNIRHCACSAKAFDHHNCGMGASSQRDSGTSMDNNNKAPRTYSVADKHSRATSPDNTEHEISSMTDWASEKNGLPERSRQNSHDARARTESLSEERGTSTTTDVPSDHYTTASEGEVPSGLSSLGERDPGIGSYQSPQQQNKNDTMEATLQTISEELARCRKLLLSQRNQEKDKSVEHKLRRSPASRQLSATYTPVCVFTLHIGALVLSDDTVVCTRDKNLVLAWKFYSQSSAMTRVQPGRVAIFDFVTEYDVVFNDDMLNYMKNSEMSIVLCEVGNEEKPFAKCWLPLQEALLHANRRVDMSLALVPCQTEDTDNRQSFGEEVGVLDIWCSLRLDKTLLSVIDRAMHKPSNNVPAWHMDPTAARESCVIQQAAEDELSRESSQSRQSRDFGLGKQSQQKRKLSMTVVAPRRSYSEYRTRSISRNFYVPGQDIPCHASERYADETQELHHPRYNFHSFTSPAQKAQLPEQQASGIIINEVPANIRTDNDMREALEQKVQQDKTNRGPKMEDYDISLKHSSFGSVSLAARHQLAKLKSPQTHKADYIATESFQDILNKDKQYSPNNMEGSDPNFSRSTNAHKYIGVPGINKLAEASRKSVKYSTAVERESLRHDSTLGLAPQQTIEITILWLALNEECEAMANPNIKRLYVAYSFLGHNGADLETPFSLPKPKHYADKCYFNFKKTFNLHEADLPMLGHMAKCRSGGEATMDPHNCVVFTLVSEPPEDPLGLSSCEDVGYAYLYLGDVLAYSGGSNGYTEVVGVRGVRGGVCGVLAVRIDNLAVLRLCLTS